MGVATGKATTSTVAVALTVGEVSPDSPFMRQDWSWSPYSPPTPTLRAGARHSYVVL